MQTILMTIACLAVVAAYVAWCRRKDRRADREHQAVMTAMSPGPRIRELTTVRPNPMRARRLASGSQPVFPATAAGDFGHVPTDYGTYTPAEVDAAILGRADTDTHHHHATPCAETPAHDAGHDVSHHDACSTVDASYGGFDGGGHHGH
jgi:ABC-type nickel/cobalt efflux system permease component RcnA